MTLIERLKMAQEKEDSRMKVFIAGHTGMVGRALHRRLKQSSSVSPLTSARRVDYTDKKEVDSVLQAYSPDAVVVCAAKVGGIQANMNQRADFIYQNLAIQMNWVEAARDCGLKKLILLSSSCVYPRDTAQPMKETQMLTGPFEPTNRPYAMAKAAGAEMCDAYFEQYGCNFYSIVPPNLYGPFDNFRIGESHVVAALIRKIANARYNGTIEVMGTGTPKREVMHVDDAAEAIEFCLKNVNAEHTVNGIVNAGPGIEVSIKKLAETIASISGKPLSAKLVDGPDGMPRKVMSSEQLRLMGWAGASTNLRDGLRMTYNWFVTAIKNPKSGIRV